MRKLVSFMHISLDGFTTNSLMDENLIDEYWLFINPILLGQGNPLFKDLSQEIRLKLLTSKTFASGVISLHYSTI